MSRKVVSHRSGFKRFYICQTKTVYKNYIYIYIYVTSWTRDLLETVALKQMTSQFVLRLHHLMLLQLQNVASNSVEEFSSKPKNLVTFRHVP